MVAVAGKTAVEVENERIESALADVCGTVNAVSARVCGLVAEALGSGVWQGDGIVSVDHWVRLQTGASSAHAARVVAVARRWSELPATMGLFSAGTLSFDQTVVVARAIPAYADAEVADLARFATVAQLSRIVNRYPWPDPDGGDDDEEWVPERATRYGHNDTGSWELHTKLRPEEGEQVEAALAAKRAELVDGQEAGERAEVSTSDVFMGIIEDFLAGRTAEARDDRDRYMTLIHLETNDGDGDPVARFHLGDRLPDSLRRYLGCDGHVKAIFEANGVAVSVGRTQRIVPDRTRRLVEHRDGGCRVPGCGQRRRLHIHHLVHWDDGGRTDTNNLCCLCPQHHRMHHRGHLRISGNPEQSDGLAFFDTQGRPITPRAPTPARDPTAWPTGQWTHPSGERCQYKWIDFSDPPSPN